MANRWIISRHRFHQHETLAAAQAEMERLTKETGKKFRMYRVKTEIKPDQGEAEHGEQG